jgi:SAM-dependent methyltransferase
MTIRFAPESAHQAEWSRAMTKGSLLRRFRNFIAAIARDKGASDAAHAAPFLDAALKDRSLIEAALHVKDYTRQALADRYWLEDALAHKDFVMRVLDQKRADEKAMAAFEAAYEAFRDASAAQGSRLPVRREDIYPQLYDATAVTGFDRHYLYHPAWAARVLARTRPHEHIDIASILHFSTIISAFLPVRFFDYRPATINLEGLSTGAADLLALPFESNSVVSLSCMHVLEHIGLGRYGEPLDPDGDLKAICELKRVLAPGGDLLVATPVGAARVQFNAHRIYDHEAFAAAFAPLELEEFALIPEHGDEGLIVSPPPERVRSESYACGCFWFRKPAG